MKNGEIIKKFSLYGGSLWECPYCRIKVYCLSGQKTRKKCPYCSKYFRLKTKV